MPSKSLGDALKSEVGVQLCLEISREPAGGAEGMENSHREKNMNSQPPRPDGFLQRELGACPQRSSGQRWCHRCGRARCFLGQKKEIKLTLHQAGDFSSSGLVHGGLRNFCKEKSTTLLLL
ncbi:uncharacterized protein LOC144246242 isoform X3 [Lonchura striata]